MQLSIGLSFIVAFVAASPFRESRGTQVLEVRQAPGMPGMPGMPGAPGAPGAAPAGPTFVTTPVKCECKRNIIIQGQCYCEDQGELVYNCAKAKNANWPFDRPPCNKVISVIDHPVEYNQCFPQADPNAGNIASDCVKTTGAKGVPGTAIDTKQQAAAPPKV